MTAPWAPRFGLFERQLVFCLGWFMAGFGLSDPAMGQLADSGYIAPDAQTAEYLDAIDQIEADYGPYATELSDLYLGLAQTLIGDGDYDRARDAMHRGILVQRVNSGPNSPEQTNQLYELANLEAMLGEMNQADEILHNVYFINSEYYGEHSAEMLPVLERIYEWYQLRRPLGSEVSKFRDYERNIELTEEMLEVSEIVNGESHPATALAYKRYAEAEFQMVRHLTGLGMTMTREDYVLATRGSLVPLGLGSESVDEHNDDGRRAYRKYLEALEANPSTTALEYATALADLADWYLVFDRSRKGRNLYEQAYTILAENPEYAGIADEFMNRPKPMHFISVPEPGSMNDLPKGVQERNLEISMTVTTTGDVRNIVFLNPPEDMPEEDLWQIKKQVQETPFRPALEKGEVVTTQEFLWNYVIVTYGEAS